MSRTPANTHQDQSSVPTGRENMLSGGSISHGGPEVALWPTQNLVRLPPTTVGRKAPRRETMLSEGSFSHGGPEVALWPTQTSRLPPTTVGRKVPRRKNDGPVASLWPTHNLGSRLPPTTVGRKAPLKSSIAPNRAVQGSARISKARKPRTTPRLSTGKSVSDLREPTNLDYWEPKSLVAAPDTSPVESSTTLTAPPSPSTTPQGQARANVQLDRTQPHYNYQTSPELEGLKRALGPCNWTEHLLLAEKYFLGEITEQERRGGSRRLYWVLEDKLRKKIDGMILRVVRVRITSDT